MSSEIEFLRKLQHLLEVRIQYLTTEGEDTPSRPEKKFRVLLDPGHSNSDPGALNNAGTLKEYTLNLLQAQVITNALKDSEIAVNVVDPDPDDLEKIGSMIVDHDMLISLHHNKYDGSRDPGTEVWVHNYASVGTCGFASILVDEISNVLGSRNRGVKTGNLAVLRAAVTSDRRKPAVLVESFFLNPYNFAIAQEKSIKAAKAIVQAIKRHFNV